MILETIIKNLNLLKPGTIYYKVLHSLFLLRIIPHNRNDFMDNNTNNNTTNNKLSLT